MAVLFPLLIEDNMASKPEPLHDGLFKPGMIVPESGIYTAVHHPAHRSSHQLMFRRGNRFPPCVKCVHNAFLAVLAAPFIEEDEDFHSPS